MLVSQYFENKFDCRIITQMREAEEGGGGRRTERQADTHRQTDRQRDRDRERGTEIEAEIINLPFLVHSYIFANEKIKGVQSLRGRIVFNF